VRWFEDIRVGDVVDVGPVTVTEEEIVEFASRYDPQPFHLDPEAAAKTPYGGLIASGWHTAALFMGMLVPAVMLDSAALGSPGIEELRWLAPVRPGDVLRGRSTVLDARPSESNPNRGTVFTFGEVLNQDDVVVLTLKARTFYARRPTAT